MASALLEIPKLTGSANYDDWAYRVKNLLMLKLLWKHVDAPKEVEADKDKEGQALSIIGLSCDIVVKNLIIDCTKAKEAWDILRNKFVRKSPAAKVALYCKLTGLKCDNIDNVMKLLSEFDVVVRKLKEIKVKVDDDLF